MVHQGSAGTVPPVSRRRARVAAVACALLVAGLLTVYVAERATGEDVDRCARFAADAKARAAVVTGSGADVLVIGDSYAAGLGLDDPGTSWPSRLEGRVRVDGFSGSGFARRASGCGPAVSFAARARAVADAPGLVVVEGGLNDVDQATADITAGFERLLRELRGERVVVVGPVAAPDRAGGVPRVDDLLARLAAAHGLAYVRTSGLTLPYLEDRLHLTPEGHRILGDAVARALAAAG